MDVGIGEHAPAVVAQAHAGVVEVGAGHVHAHVGARPVLGAGVPGMYRIHATVSHAAHAALGHGAHHVHHAQPLGRIQRRDVGGHARPGRQGAAGIAGAIHGLGEDGIGAVVLGLHDHVVGFAGAEAELVHGHRFDVLTVHVDHGHLQAGNAHVEEALGAAADEAQAHPFAAFEQCRPVAGRRRAVHQVGVGIGGNVGQIRRAHAHPVPHAPLFPGPGKAQGRGVAEEVADRELVEVVVVALLLEFGEHVEGILVGPVGELHHVVPIGADPVPFGRIDDDGAIHAGLFLEAGMGVIPVGAGLPDLEAIDEGLAGRDAGKAHAGNAIHFIGQDDAVPVNRGGHGQAVGDAEGDRVALAPAQDGAGNAAVDGGGHARRAGEVYRGLGNHQIEFGTGEDRRHAGAGGRLVAGQGGSDDGAESQQGAAGGQPLDETPPGRIGQKTGIGLRSFHVGLASVVMTGQVLAGKQNRGRWLSVP